MVARIERSEIQDCLPGAGPRISLRSSGLRLLDPVPVEDTDHCRLLREFWNDPAGFVETMLEE